MKKLALEHLAHSRLHFKLPAYQLDVTHGTAVAGYGLVR